VWGWCYSLGGGVKIGRTCGESRDSVDTAVRVTGGGISGKLSAQKKQAGKQSKCPFGGRGRKQVIGNFKFRGKICKKSGGGGSEGEKNGPTSGQGHKKPPKRAVVGEPRSRA